jgi:hypothetical protein
MGETLAHARETSGLVVDIVYESPTLQKGREHPVVRFTAMTGGEVTGRSEKHYRTARGARLNIVYDVRNPERIEIGTLSQARKQRLFVSGGMVIAGIALTLAGLLRRLE